MQPFVEVPVTVYVEFKDGLNVKVEHGSHGAAGLYIYEFAPFAVKVTAPPTQIGFVETFIVTFGNGRILTEVTAEFVHPFEFVTVHKKSLSVLAEIDCVVCVELHK